MRFMRVPSGVIMYLVFSLVISRLNRCMTIVTDSATIFARYVHVMFVMFVVPEGGRFNAA